MSILSYFFPDEATKAARRLERARRLLAEGRPEFARHELVDWDHPESKPLLVEAETILARRNLEAAIQSTAQRDDARAEECLELAEQFHHGGLEAEFQAARREMREIRAARDQGDERARAEKNARLMSADPLGLTGGPSWLDPVADGAALDEDREELEQRLALLVENYPEDLRAQIPALGPEFADAALSLQEGRAEVAIQQLALLSDESAPVQWERARAAHALGDPAASVRALRQAVRILGGHRTFGGLHSGVYLAQLLAESGDVTGGLRVLRDVRVSEPKQGAFLFAQLLRVTGGFEEAERVLVALVRDHPKEPSLFAELARVRIDGGHRAGAIRALEAGMESCCGSRSCGSKGPDLDTHRLLATLYLEDGADVPRGLELAAAAASLARQPTWDDAYLRVLAARIRRDPDAEALARRLLEVTPADHPGAPKVAGLLTVDRAPSAG